MLPEILITLLSIAVCLPQVPVEKINKLDHFKTRVALNIRQPYENTTLNNKEKEKTESGKINKALTQYESTSLSVSTKIKTAHNLTSFKKRCIEVSSTQPRNVIVTKHVIQKREISPKIENGNDDVSSIHPGHGEMSPHIIQKREVPDQELDQSLTFTCRNKCGKTRRFPCSCSAVCVLYDTCCENFTQDCPKVALEGRTKFSPFMDEDVRCELQNINVIFSMPCFTQNFSSKIFYKYPTHLTQDEINQYLVEAPVTDSTSGLTFRTREIYNCYKKTLLFDTGVLTWGVKLRHRPASTLEKSISNTAEKSLYQPTFDESILNEHLCRNNVINSCDRNQVPQLQDNQYELYANKCLEFTGLVHDFYSRKVYRNRFCAYCRGVMESIEVYNYEIERRTTFSLSVLLSLSGDGGYNLKLAEGTLGVPQSWADATCPNLDTIFIPEMIGQDVENEKSKNSKADGGEGGISCEASQCHPMFEVDSDGICRADYHMLVAFKDNEVGLPPLGCSSAVHQIGEFIACILQLRLNYGPWEQAAAFRAERTYVALEQNTTNNFYFMEITFRSAFNKNGMLDFKLGTNDFNLNIQKLSQVVKAFHSHRVSENICPLHMEGDLNKEKNIREFNLTSKILTSPYFKSLKYKKMVELRGDILDDLNVTVVCFSAILPMSENLSVSCIEDFVYRDDKREVESLLTSHCVDHLMQISSVSPPREDTINVFLAPLLFFIICTRF